MYAHYGLSIITSSQLLVAGGAFLDRRNLYGTMTLLTLLLLFVVTRVAAGNWTVPSLARRCVRAGFFFGLVLLSTAMVGDLATTHVAHAAAGINPELSFEGKIVDGSGQNIPDGTYNMEFKIYQDGNSSGVGSTLKWTEDRLVSAGNGVTFNSGTFQVNLGSVNPFGASVDWNQDTLWLSLQVGNTASCSPFSSCGGDGEMTPFIRLTSTPYAMNAGELDGIDSSGFVQLGATQSGNINIGTGTITSGAVNGISIGSTVQPSAAGALTVKANGANALTLTGGAASTWSTTAGALTITAAAASTWSTSAGNLTLQAGSGTVSLGSSTTLTATGALTVAAGGANALTLTGGAASTWSTSAGNLTLQAGSGTVSLGSSTTLTATGALTAQAGGANALTLTGGAASTWSTSAGNLTLQAGSGTVSLGSSTTLTATGALTVQAGGANALTLKGGAASTWSTTAGALTITAAAASTWSTSAGNLTLQAGSGTVSLGSSTALTATAGIALSSGGANALAIDTGGGAAINIGGTNATSIVIGGNTAATITEKVANTSTAAFTLQTAGGTDFMVADSTDNRLYIGNPTADGTATLVVFDSYNVTGNPANGVNGSEYYNSANNKFRCDQGGIWQDCVPWTKLMVPTDESRATTTTLAADGTMTFAMAASTDYSIRCSINYSTGATPDFKFSTSGPATPTYVETLLQTWAQGAAAFTYALQTAATPSTPLTGGAGDGYITFTTDWENGTTAGTWAFNWAQNTSNGTAAIVHAGSYCEYTKTP